MENKKWINDYNEIRDKYLEIIRQSSLKDQDKVRRLVELKDRFEFKFILLKKLDEWGFDIKLNDKLKEIPTHPSELLYGLDSEISMIARFKEFSLRNCVLHPRWELYGRSKGSGYERYFEIILDGISILEGKVFPLMNLSKRICEENRYLPDATKFKESGLFISKNEHEYCPLTNETVKTVSVGDARRINSVRVLRLVAIGTDGIINLADLQKPNEKPWYFCRIYPGLDIITDGEKYLTFFTTGITHEDRKNRVSPVVPQDSILNATDQTLIKRAIEEWHKIEVKNEDKSV